MSQEKLKYQLDIRSDSTWLTVTPSPTAKNSIMYVQELGDFIAGPQYFTRREGLDSFLMKYTIAGRGKLHYQGKVYTLKPDQLYWIDCREPQYYCTDPDTGNWRVLWVHFYGATAAAYYDIFQAQTKGNPVVTMSPTNRVARALRALISLYENKGSSTTPTDVYASELLLQILSDAIRSTELQQQYLGIPTVVENARDYLTGHYAEHITLDTLAEKFSISKYHFQKLFKHYLGLSPNEYLMQLRFSHAKELLRATDNSVAEIACDVGIQNVSYFINVFRKMEGSTPAQYRSNWK